MYQGYLDLTGRYDITPRNNGGFKNILSIVLVLNDNTQTLFGLDLVEYNLYSANSNSNSKNVIKQIIGNRKIGIDVNPSRHIKIYTDIIRPVNFGNQNL